MNIRHTASALLLLPFLAACLGDGTLDDGVDCQASGAELIQRHCLACHSAALGARERGSAPLGVDFDTEEDIRRQADDIRLEVIEKETMPEERPFAQCEKDSLQDYLVSLEEACQPSCSGKTCGDDGCGGSCGVCGKGEICDVSECVPDLPSYTRHIVPIWQAHGCASSGCHGGSRPEEGLNLGNARAGYEALVEKASQQCGGKLLVVPEDAGSSYLWSKLTGVGMCGGSRMPKGRSKLPDHDLDTVRIWIQLGAAP